MTVSGGFLRLPRVRVYWGKTNLSAYEGGPFEKGTPIVYDVQVNLNAENEAPTAEMKWDPTGPGFAVYEEFVKTKLSEQITIEYFYPQGKKIVFIFVWGGQSINYGNDMSVTVKMVSELAGLVNGNIRNTAQAYGDEGAKPVDFVEKLKKQYKLEKASNLVQYNEGTLKYWDKVKLLNQYGNDWTFGNALSSIAKQTGDQTFPININQASIVLMPPFSSGSSSVTEATVTSPPSPKPTIRYGYFLGPSIINSVTRSAMWKPPQQSNDNTPGTQKFATTTGGASPSPSQTKVEETKKATSAPVGTANGRSTPAIVSKNNPQGPARQNALNAEKGSELNFSTLMCPVLVGLKPHDILYIPSLTGEYIEDWIVQSVGYSQQNGNVELSVQATRVLGAGTPMNEKEGKKFLDSAKAKKLVGPGATLDAWDLYAWGKFGSLQ